MTHPIDLARVLVTVCTYGRPEPLRAFLDSYVADPTTADATLLVVDNNPDGGARATVEAYAGRRIVYAHEPRPGIAAARNRCLAGIEEDTQAFVFVDDDEYVEPGWLGELAACADLYGVDIVNGQVDTVFPDDAPGWVRARGLFGYPQRETGSSDGLPATNNTLVRREAWERAGSPGFDERFSGSGGSDTEFFWHLVNEAGCTFVWSAEAVVHEPLTPDRMSLRWAWRRHLRGGNVLGRLKLREESRAHVMLGGVGRVGKGLAGGAVTAVTGHNPSGWLVGRVARGVGMSSSAMRHVVVEYSRGGAG
ncbi:glycosyltransferase [Demequina sp.]|uniref:glycosyltransferase family 2 protein n=1 Tax=Demequina sp. TaxID=2050685 RepID=UPI0025EE57FE|nr:glycosyltransferase [Demequina sp.]